MAKEYKVGEGYFLPVKITSTDYDREFPVQFSYFDGQDHYTECVQDGTLLTAEEIVKASNLPAVLIEEGLTARITELEAKNATLTAELEEEKANTYGWTNTAEERGRLISGLRESLHEASEENLANDEALAQMSVKKAELKAENEKLKQQLADANELLSDAQAKVKELTEADCMRLQEFKPIIEERDRLKAEAATRTENVKNLVEENDQLKKIADELGDENEKLKAENEQEKKRTQVWKDSSEEHRQRAEELEGDVRRYEQDISEVEVTVQKLTKENDSLKADIFELKAQIDVFRPDPKEIEALKKRINMLEKLKEVHVRVIRRSTRQLKEKDFMISALVKKGIELEEGGKR